MQKNNSKALNNKAFVVLFSVVVRGCTYLGVGLFD